MISLLFDQLRFGTIVTARARGIDSLKAFNPSKLFILRDDHVMVRVSPSAPEIPESNKLVPITHVLKFQNVSPPACCSGAPPSHVKIETRDEIPVGHSPRSRRSYVKPLGLSLASERLKLLISPRSWVGGWVGGSWERSVWRACATRIDLSRRWAQLRVWSTVQNFCKH